MFVPTCAVIVCCFVLGLPQQLVVLCAADYSTRNLSKSFPSVRLRNCLTLSKVDTALGTEVNDGQDGGSSVEAQDGGGDAEGRVALGGEGAVSDLGGLERDDHVRGGAKHGKVSGDGRAE